MYRHLYGLTAKPFQISTDPAFLWLGGKHREALAVLVYGVRDGKGFLLLSGGVGTGKTTLIRTLLGQLERNVVVATVHDPGLTPMAFFNFIAAAYGMRRRYTNKVDFLFDFEKFLRKTRAAGRSALLIVDEAQRLDQSLLEEIRLLSNIEDPDQKLLNVFFVGQEEFLEVIAAPENRALKQRITINYHLEALSPQETEQLVRHRLQVAGATREIFTPDAYPLIHRFSQGAPRLINILCDHALLTGFVKDAGTIGADIIAECIEDLMLPGEHPRHRPPEGAERPRPVAATVTAGMMLQKQPPPSRRTRWPRAAVAGLLLAVGVGGLMQHSGPPFWGGDITTRLTPSASQASVAPEKPPEAPAGASSAKREAVGQAATVAMLPEAVPGPPPPMAADPGGAGTPEDARTGFAARPAPAPEREADAAPDDAPPQPAAPDFGLPQGHLAQPPPVGHEIPDPLPPPGPIDGEASVKRTETAAEAEWPPAATPAPFPERIAEAPRSAGTGPSPAAPERGMPERQRLEAPDMAAAPVPLRNDAGKSVAEPAATAPGAARDRVPPLAETSARAASLPPAPATAPNDDSVPESPASTTGDAPVEIVAALPAPAPASAGPDTTRSPAGASAPLDGMRPPPPESPLGPLENPAPARTAALPEPPASSPAPADSTGERLRDFISAYAQAYESLDLDRFRLFFAEDAVENGHPFSTVLPTYRKNFAALAGLEYRIDLMSWERDEATGRIRLSGAFNVRYALKGRDWRTTQGEITMDLVSRKGVYRVGRLEYKKISD